MIIKYLILIEALEKNMRIRISIVLGGNWFSNLSSGSKCKYKDIYPSELDYSISTRNCSKHLERL